VPNEGSTVGGDDSHFVFLQRLFCEDGNVRQRCQGEAARSFLAKVLGDFFVHFHGVAAKPQNRRPEFIIWHVGTGASHYYNCCIDGDTSTVYFGYHRVYVDKGNP
jgi:hypothetical protein